VKGLNDTFVDGKCFVCHEPCEPDVYHHNKCVEESAEVDRAMREIRKAGELMQKDGKPNKAFEVARRKR
jgi:hypothetical protein